MLKLLMRLARRRKIDDGSDPLKIRNLLDDPRLAAVMGDGVEATFDPPTQLFAHDPIVTVGVRFGRRQLLDQAA